MNRSTMPSQNSLPSNELVRQLRATSNIMRSKDNLHPRTTANTFLRNTTVKGASGGDRNTSTLETSGCPSVLLRMITPRGAQRKYNARDISEDRRGREKALRYQSNTCVRTQGESHTQCHNTAALDVRYEHYQGNEEKLH